MNKYQELLHKLDEIDISSDALDLFAEDLETLSYNIDIQILDDFFSDDPNRIRSVILSCLPQTWFDCVIRESIATRAQKKELYSILEKKENE